MVWSLNIPKFRLTRRDFLSVGGAAAWGLSRDLRADFAPTSSAGFLLIGDTHYFADENDPTKLDPRSRKVTSALVKTVQEMRGTSIPPEAGGGIVQIPNGLIHAGDLIDSGDKNGSKYQAMQETEWKAYCADFGIGGLAGNFGLSRVRSSRKS